MRDVALAASGLLNPALGGPSVCPPAPDFLFQPPASYGPKPVAAGARAESLSPGDLHVSLPLGSLSDAASLRRAAGRRGLRAPRPLEHAAASAGDA